MRFCSLEDLAMRFCNASPPQDAFLQSKDLGMRFCNSNRPRDAILHPSGLRDAIYQPQDAILQLCDTPIIMLYVKIAKN